jgi:hypothetical protein
MAYKVVRTAEGSPRIVLDDEPVNCKALEATPHEREPELNKGLWLVMAFAAWSVPDINAIQTAIDVVKSFDRGLKLGLRPFDSAEEHGAWCPGLENDENSPLWVALRNGQVCLKTHGFLTVDDLVKEIEAACLE